MRQIVAPKGGQCGAAPKILAIPMVQAYRFSFSAMGSPCELQIYAENHALAERVANLAMADLRRIETRYSRYRDDSIFLAWISILAALPRSMRRIGLPPCA
jgi:hypothetical protein